MAMDISVVLISYNTAELLSECLKRIEESTAGLRREIIVVDNASRDRSVELVKARHPQCRLIANAANLGFARAVNQALQYATGRYLLLVNPDALVGPDTIAKTVAYMDAHDNCGVLGVKNVSPSGQLHPSARYFPTPWNTFVQRAGLERFFSRLGTVDDMGWDHASVRHCDWVPGCYFLVRRAVIDEVGLFDPRYFLYYEEVDHCLAAKKAGWDIVFYPDAQVIHIGGQSAKSEGEGILVRTGPELEALRVESELLYFRKNHGVLGVWLSVLLTTLANAIVALKRLLKLNFPVGIGMQARHCLLVWSLFGRTHYGTRPTR
jgi:N-acetylglucosaminyl-diphospho-decaprenol L-rhamnosyltransferase